MGDPAGTVDFGAALGSFLQYGVTGLVVVLLVVGVIAPKYVVTTLTQEKNNWKDAFEAEKAAHQATRESLMRAEERGDIALEQGRAMNIMLTELGHRTDANRSV